MLHVIPAVMQFVILTMLLFVNICLVLKSLFQQVGPLLTDFSSIILFAEVVRTCSVLEIVVIASWLSIIHKHKPIHVIFGLIQ